MAADAQAHGWLVIDKPLGLSSSRVVEIVRRATGTKVGHAGTLDPLATGVLPLALGEARKTVAYAMTGRKFYRFRIRWGVARATDDGEGEIVGESPARPGHAAIEAMLPRFVGTILQTPPAFSAIKVGGRRAYALARAGEPPTLPARPVEIGALRLTAIPDRDHAICEAIVGKGAYIRALARDLGVALGTFAHVAELRRLAVGRFTEAEAISLDSVAQQGHSMVVCRHLLPIETALDGIPAVSLSAAEAARLRHGQIVSPHDVTQPAALDLAENGAVVSAWQEQTLVALARVEHGGLRPLRIINL